ncbi:MAG: phosphate ABC transporter substrate-binding protein PstS [Alphaproteobacteria bacterium]|nr:phosphate ABC transporter substrate-binding protein PstS [Alphaproteobacteria bacterium]
MTSFSKNVKALLWGVLFVSLALGASASTGDICGAGATFPYPVYAKWADAYRKETGTGVNYQAIGSGGGIKQVKAGTIAFGATDKPLEESALEAAGLVQWPMVIGGVVPVVNIDGVAPGGLVLDGATLAAIYLGRISFWDDPKIKELNPALSLPHRLIVQVYRADGSGTSFLFTSYLAAVSDAFADQVGAGASVQWPAGMGAKGNEGVANMTVRTLGAIGYVEYAYAVQNKLAFVKMVNKAGKTVAPSFETFQAAAVHADWASAPGFCLNLADQPGEKSWPMTGASFILMPKHPANKRNAEKALAFFDWAYKNGAEETRALDYVPMPDSVVTLIKASWKQIDLGEQN